MRQIPKLAVALAWSLSLCSFPAFAASHREAPLTALEPAINNTDVYAFVSFDPANLSRTEANRRVTFIMNYIPGQEPSDGPNYFNFDDSVSYRMNIDNSASGKANNLIYEFKFTTQNRPVGGAGGLTSPVPYLGNPHISNTLPLQGITALDGAGSEGLTRRQVYTVTEIRNGVSKQLFAGKTLVAVPSNVGPATMPNYAALAQQGIYQEGDVRVFVGQRAESFYADLGAIFDTLNLRRYPPLLTVAEDADTTSNPFGINRFSGTNISTIAIELPITSVTSDGKPPQTTAHPVIGVYAEADRPQTTTLDVANTGTTYSGPYVQVSRMANPLVNELIINTPYKDKWNTFDPSDEATFESFYTNPVIASELKLVYGFDIVPLDGSPANDRTDLMSILLKYPGQALSGSHCGKPCAELLRLDLRVPPTAPESQNRLGAALSSDLAGWPNGRRPNDDVVDIAIRVVGGKNYVAAHAGDGVNYVAGLPGKVGVDITAGGIARQFPFLATPYDGKFRRQVDCGETGPGGNPCGKPVP